MKKFDYKNGEDYTCVLCEQEKHTHGPRPDNLCDSCWELKTRVESQPELARRVLMALSSKEGICQQGIDGESV